MCLLLGLFIEQTGDSFVERNFISLTSHFQNSYSGLIKFSERAWKVCLIRRRSHLRSSFLPAPSRRAGRQLHRSCEDFSTPQTWSLLISHRCQPAGSDLMSQLMLNRGVAQIRSNSYEKWILNRVEHVDVPCALPSCIGINRARLFWMKTTRPSINCETCGDDASWHWVQASEEILIGFWGCCNQCQANCNILHDTS